MGEDCPHLRWNANQSESDRRWILSEMIKIERDTEMLKRFFSCSIFFAVILGLMAWTDNPTEAAVRKERIMVVIPEVHLGRPKVPDPAGETEIVRTLIEEGYKLVDQEKVKKIRYNDIFDKAWKGDDSGALKVARLAPLWTTTEKWHQNYSA